MKKTFLPVLFIVLSWGFCVSAAEESEPLPDYVAQFKEADAKIRAIDASIHCTNYCQWVDQAIEAKIELKLRNEIDPWLNDLAATYTNNWRILHASAYGIASSTSYHSEEERSIFVNLMDQAYHQIETENTAPSDQIRFCNDYISMLLDQNAPYLLQLKTLAHSDNEIGTEKEQLLETIEHNPKARIAFFNQPESYETAANDGELIRWLLHQKETLESRGSDLTLADVALLTAGSHINVPLQYTHRFPLDPDDNDNPPEYAQNILMTLKDNESVCWGSESNEYCIVQLPEEYCYIHAYEQQTANGNTNAAQILGHIFENRCQFERAAQWFEQTGYTNKVRDLRSNQGMILPHSAYIFGKPISVDYFFRNGSEVEFELYPINVGTNLLPRLITKQITQTELELMEGKWEPRIEFKFIDNVFNCLEDRIHNWTLPLSPSPDHRDTKRSVELPNLDPGNYLLRATMKDGNTSETLLHIYDTRIYCAEALESYGSFYILCDALTGEPRINHDLHFCKISEDEESPFPTLDQYLHAQTDTNGVFIYDHLPDWKVIDLTPNHAPSTNRSQTPFISDVDAGGLLTYDPKRRETDSRFFKTTDRPIYRPGDTGHLKLWCNPDSIDKFPKIELTSDYKNNSLLLTLNSLKNRSGRPVPDSFGGIDYSFTIPDDAPLGGYWCKIGNDHYKYRDDFRVEEYRAPEMKLIAKLDGSEQIRIDACYTYGKPLSSGTITGTLRFEKSYTHWFYPAAPLDPAWGKGYWWNGAQFQTGIEKIDKPHLYTNFTNTLNSAGQTWVDLSTVSNAMTALDIPGYFDLSLTATDPADKQMRDWLIVPTPSAKGPKFCCWLNKAFYTINEPITCNIAAETPHPLHLKLFNHSDTNAIPLREIPLTQQPLTIQPLPAGTYSITLCDDEENASQPFEFAVIDDATSDLSVKNPVRLIVEKGVYQTNETVRILIQVDQPGRNVYWLPRVIDEYGFSSPEFYHMDTVSKVVELPLCRMDNGIFHTAAFTIVDGEEYLAKNTIHVISPELDTGTIQITPNQKTYKPGEEVSLNIHTLDSSGKGRPCSVTLTVYNKTLDLWSYNNPSQIIKALFSRWINCINESVDVKTAEFPKIEALHPKWIMKSILPKGRSPITARLSLSRTHYCSLFGAATFSSSYDPLDAEDSAPDNLRIREDFRDLAYWNASVVTDSNGCANVTFPMPDGLVEWKIKAWAMHTNYAAEAETSIRCTKDFVANLNVPRFMVEGDELEFSTSVRNHTTNALDCSVDGLIEGDSLSLQSPAQQTIIQLAPGREQRGDWTLRAEKAGSAEITTTAISASASDGMKRTLPIHPHGMLKRGGHGGVLAGRKTSETLEIVIPDATDPESLAFSLHTTPDLLEALSAALPYLADYPYGCTEQTLNRFLPSLVVMQTMQELGIDTLTAASNMPPDRIALLNTNTILERAQEGINRLEDAKNYSGWGWNMDSNSPRDPLLTAWVARGLYMANQIHQLDVDNYTFERPLESTLSNMEDLIEDAEKSDKEIELSNTDAFLVLVISETAPSLLNNYDWKQDKWLPETEKIETLHAFTDLLFNHADQLSLYGKILLANAYELQENTEKRDRLLAFIEQYLEHDAASGEYSLRTHSREYWYWYNDDIELHAWYLKLLNRIDPHGAKTAGFARHLMQNRIYGDHWKSTRDTAICIEALAEFAKNNQKEPSEKTFTLSRNGQTVTDPATAHLSTGTNTLTITTTDGAPLFFDATWSYYSKEDPIPPESCDLISIARTYSRLGQNTNIVIQPNEAVHVGEIIEVKLTITAAQTLEYLLAEDHKPAGFETIETSSGYSQGSFRELHDERVSFYLNHISKGTTTLTYRIRAEHTGRISALPATIELMYEPRQAANGAERKLEIQR